MEVPPGTDPITERDVRAVVRRLSWGEQRAVWQQLRERDTSAPPPGTAKWAQLRGA